MTDNGPDVRLAVSLNSADESVRSRLMPISRTNPLEKLKKSLLVYQEKRRKRITFEYVLLQGINDRLKDVELLVDFLDGLKGVVNETLRRGLSVSESPSPEQPRFEVRAKACGFLPGIDPFKLNQLVDDLEVTHFVAAHARSEAD